MKAKFNAPGFWNMHKRRTEKEKGKNLLLKLARQGSKLAVRKLKENYGIKFSQESC